MLDEVDTQNTGGVDGDDEKDDALLVFQDSKGQVWQLIKRDDFENFDELIETAEDEEMAGVFSDKIKLFDVPAADQRQPGKNQGG